MLNRSKYSYRTLVIRLDQLQGCIKYFFVNRFSQQIFTNVVNVQLWTPIQSEPRWYVRRDRQTDRRTDGLAA
jgi:hypothetical protein